MPPSMSNARVYRELATFSDFAGVADPSCYTHAPDDWWMVVSDVAGSTQAIGEGRYRDVNALGTCSIVAVLRAVGETELPYVFGGDGATILVPPGSEASIREVLGRLAGMATRLFGLSLRVGMVPVEQLRRAGGEVKVARFSLSSQLSLAMLSGGSRGPMALASRSRSGLSGREDCPTSFRAFSVGGRRSRRGGAKW